MRFIKFFRRLYSHLIKTWDKHHCDFLVCSIGDIVLRRQTPSNNQLLLTSRLMDVEDYLSGRDISFPHQNAISYKAYGNAHKEERGNTHFRTLIESYRKDGYHEDSYVTCDSDLVLMDGNHRMGIHLYEKISKVNVRMVHRRVKAGHGFDWYYKVALPSAFIDDLFKKYRDVQEWLIKSGNTFIALFDEPEDGDLSVESDLSHLTTPLRIIDGPFTFNEINGVDVSSVKWKKIVQFSLDNPKYYVQNGLLRSKRIDEIRSIMIRRYGESANILLSNNCLEGNEIYKRLQSLNR